MRKAEKIFTNICTTVGFIVLIGLTLGLLLFGCSNEANTSGKDRFKYIHGDTFAEFKIYKDKETSCKYLILDDSVNGSGSSITPLLAKDGMPDCY